MKGGGCGWVGWAPPPPVGGPPTPTGGGGGGPPGCHPPAHNPPPHGGSPPPPPHQQPHGHPPNTIKRGPPAPSQNQPIHNRTKTPGTALRQEATRRAFPMVCRPTPAPTSQDRPNDPSETRRPPSPSEPEHSASVPTRAPWQRMGGGGRGVAPRSEL